MYEFGAVAKLQSSLGTNGMRYAAGFFCHAVHHADNRVAG